MSWLVTRPSVANGNVGSWPSTSREHSAGGVQRHQLQKSGPQPFAPSVMHVMAWEGFKLPSLRPTLDLLNQNHILTGTARDCAHESLRNAGLQCNRGNTQLLAHLGQDRKRYWATLILTGLRFNIAHTLCFLNGPCEPSRLV